MGKLLKLPTKQSKPLAKPGNGRSTALRIKGASGNPSSATRQKMDSLKGEAAKNRKLQTQALAEEARKTEEERQKEEFDKILNEQATKTSALVAIVLDYTASTINDVHNFRADARKLQQRLEQAFQKGVTTIPVTVSGGNDGWRLEPKIRTGKDNNLDFFEGVENICWKGETPIGYGIEAIAGRFTKKDGLFQPDSTVKAVIAMSDNVFEQPDSYSEVNRGFNENGVVVASLLTDAYYYQQSHIEAITQPLGDRGIVIDRTNPEMDPLNLVMEILLNIRDNLFRTAALKEVQQRAAKRQKPVSPTVQKRSSRISLADQLTLKGHSGTAKSVIQGGVTRKLLK